MATSWWEAKAGRAFARSRASVQSPRRHPAGPRGVRGGLSASVDAEGASPVVGFGWKSAGRNEAGRRRVEKAGSSGALPMIASRCDRARMRGRRVDLLPVGRTAGRLVRAASAVRPGGRRGGKRFGSTSVWVRARVRGSIGDAASPLCPGLRSFGQGRRPGEGWAAAVMGVDVKTRAAGRRAGGTACRVDRRLAMAGRPLFPSRFVRVVADRTATGADFFSPPFVFFCLIRGARAVVPRTFERSPARANQWVRRRPVALGCRARGPGMVDRVDLAGHGPLEELVAEGVRRGHRDRAREGLVGERPSSTGVQAAPRALGPRCGRSTPAGGRATPHPEGRTQPFAGGLPQLGIEARRGDPGDRGEPRFREDLGRRAPGAKALLRAEQPPSRRHGSLAPRLDPRASRAGTRGRQGRVGIGRASSGRLCPTRTHGM